MAKTGFNAESGPHMACTGFYAESGPHMALGVLGGSPGAAATEKLELTKLNKAAVMKLAKEMGIETRNEKRTWRPVDEVRQDIEASLVSQS